MKRLFFLLAFALSAVSVFSQQQIQYKRVVITDSFYLKNRWIMGISTNILSDDSLLDRKIPSVRAVWDAIKNNTGTATIAGNFLKKSGNTFSIADTLAASFAMNAKNKAMVYDSVYAYRMYAQNWTLGGNGGHGIYSQPGLLTIGGPYAGWWMANGETYLSNLIDSQMFSMRLSDTSIRTVYGRLIFEPKYDYSKQQVYFKGYKNNLAIDSVLTTDTSGRLVLRHKNDLGIVGGVSSVFGRSGAVVAQTGDYSFSQISGAAVDAQLPATLARTVFGRTGTVVAQTGDYSFSQISGAAVDAQLPATLARTVFGRTGTVVAQTGDYSFSQISGGVDDAQLSSNVAKKNQANTFTNDNIFQGSILSTPNIGTGERLATFHADGTVHNRATIGNSFLDNIDWDKVLNPPLLYNADVAGDSILVIVNDAEAKIKRFNSNDFSSTGDLVSLDYTNGQKANASQPGLLTAADYAAFSTIRTLYTQAAEQTLTNSTTETNLLTSGIGSATLPANYLTVGKTINIKGGGALINTSGSTENLTVKIKIGGVTVASQTLSVLSGCNNCQAFFDIEISCKSTGASGTVINIGHLEYGNTFLPMHNLNATSTINTTVSNNVEVTYQWTTASSSLSTRLGVAKVVVSN